MPDITATAPDGTTHTFPEGTDPSVVDRVMKNYITQGKNYSAINNLMAKMPAGTPTPTPSPAAVQQFRSDYFNTLNPNANVLMQTAQALAKAPNDPSALTNYMLMSPVAQAAITQKAHDLAAAPVYDPSAPVGFQGGFGIAPTYRDPQSNQRTAIPQPHDILGTMLHGPEGYRQLQQAQGVLPELTRMAEGSMDPENIALLLGAGALGATGKAGATAVKLGMGAMMGNNAVQRARQGDIGGAGVDAILGALPFAHGLPAAIGDHLLPPDSIPAVHPDFTNLDLTSGAVERPVITDTPAAPPRTMGVRLGRIRPKTAPSEAEIISDPTKDTLPGGRLINETPEQFAARQGDPNEPIATPSARPEIPARGSQSELFVSGIEQAIPRNPTGSDSGIQIQVAGDVLPTVSDGIRSTELPTPISEPPVTPSEGRYAGNINLDYLNTPEEVKAHIARVADENATGIEQARGGTISRQETIQAAKDMNLTPEQLQAAVPGASAAKIMAIRDLHLKAGEAAHEAYETARAEPTSENQAAAEEAAANYRLIQETLAGHTAEAGRTLAIFKQLAEARRANDYTPQGLVERMQAANPQVAMTTEEHASVADTSARLADIEQRQATLDAQKPELDEADSRAAAEETLKQAQKEAKPRSIRQRQAVRKQTAQTLDAEHDDLVKQFVQANSKAGAGFDPSSLPILRKIAANRIKAGVNTVEGVVDHLYETFKDHFPGITKREIRDAWTGYGQGSKIPRDTAMADLKEQARLLSEIEDVNNRVQKTRTPRPVSDAVKTLRQQKAEAIAAQKEAPKSPTITTEERQQNALRTRVQNKIDDLNRRIQEGDFSKPQRNHTVPDVETQKLIHHRDGLQQAYDSMDPDKIAAKQQREQALAQKVADRAQAAQARQEAREQLKAEREANRDPFAVYKKQLQNQIDDYQRQTAAGVADAPKVKLQRTYDAETQKLQQERDAAKREFQQMVAARRPKTLSGSLVQGWKAGLLSSLRTIAKVVASHASALTEDFLGSIPASLADSLIAQKSGNGRTLAGTSLSQMGDRMRQAATQGVRESIEIMKKGEARANLQNIGIDTKSGLFEHPQVNNKAGQFYIDMISNAHAVAYRPFRLAAFTRALQSEANLIAMKEGGGSARAKELLDNPTDEMVATAAFEGEKAVYLNRNRFTDGVSNFRSGQTPIGKAATDMVLPFAKVASNLTSKHVTRIPIAGAVPEILRVVGDIKSGTGLTPETQRAVVQAIGKQTTGTGLMALGAYLASKGLMRGYNKEHDREGAILVGGRWYEVKNFAPVGNMMALGATLAEGKETPYKAFVESAAENPVTRSAETISGMMDKDPRRAVGGVVGSVVPQFLSDLAANLDDQKRKKKEVADYVQERIPGLRQRLPGNGKPESNKLIDPTNSVRAKR